MSHPMLDWSMLAASSLSVLYHNQIWKEAGKYLEYGSGVLSIKDLEAEEINGKKSVPDGTYY